MTVLNSEEEQIAFQAKGKGETLVFLHGFCLDNYIWDEFALHFGDYRTIQVDLPGFGQSDLPENLSLLNMADAVKRILDTLEVKKATIIGHSMGGYVALAFMEKYKSSTSGVVLFNSSPFADDQKKQVARKKSIDFIRAYGHQIYIKQLIPALFTNNFVGSNAFLMEKLMHAANKLPPENIIAAILAIKQRKDRSELLKDTDIPVLFIIGAEDSVTDPEKAVAAVQYPFRSAIKLLKGVNHMAMFEAPKKCIRALKDFLEFCKI